MKSISSAKNMISMKYIQKNKSDFKLSDKMKQILMIGTLFLEKKISQREAKMILLLNNNPIQKSKNKSKTNLIKVNFIRKIFFFKNIIY